jgi:hypothetical protein
VSVGLDTNGRSGATQARAVVLTPDILARLKHRAEEERRIAAGASAARQKRDTDQDSGNPVGLLAVWLLATILSLLVLSVLRIIPAHAQGQPDDAWVRDAHVYSVRLGPYPRASVGKIIGIIRIDAPDTLVEVVR